jgi:hypothetical protein
MVMVMMVMMMMIVTTFHNDTECVCVCECLYVCLILFERVCGMMIWTFIFYFEDLYFFVDGDGDVCCDADCLGDGYV